MSIKHFDEEGRPIPEAKRHTKDRREKVEGWRRWLYGFSILGWLLILASLVLFHYARPEFKSGLDVHWGLVARETWDKALADWLFYCSSAVCFLSLLSLAVNAKFQRRKTDRYWPSLVMLLLSSLVGIVWYLVAEPAM